MFCPVSGPDFQSGQVRSRPTSLSQHPSTGKRGPDPGNLTRFRSFGDRWIIEGDSHREIKISVCLHDDIESISGGELFLKIGLEFRR